jgi:hydrogenase maturation factor
MFRVTRPQPAECRDDHCITCSDQGTVAQVVEPPPSEWEDALVKTAAGVEAVDVSLVGAVRAGDRVLIHAGAAIGRLDRDGAEIPR